MRYSLLVLMSVILLFSCEEAEVFKRADSILVLRPTIHPTILLDNGDHNVSKRQTLSHQKRVRTHQEVSVSNLNLFNDRLIQSLQQKWGSFKHIHFLSVEKTNRNPDLKDLARDRNETLIVATHIDIRVDNKQRLYKEEDEMFFSQKYQYHWSQRVYEPNLASLIATIQLEYYDLSQDRLGRYVLELGVSNDGIRVESNDLITIDALESVWFSRLEEEIMSQLTKLFIK